MPPSSTDSALIREVLTGNVAAFTMLVEQYQQYVFTLVLRYVPGREEAEELAQDVFVKAYRSLSQFRQESRFSTWLYTIVHSICLSHLRKKESPVVHVEEDKLAVLADQGAHYAPSGAEQRSQRQLLHDAIGQLKDDDARLITLFYQGEQSLDEIALILGQPAPTVKVRLHRARTRLRDLLIAKHPGELQNFNER